MFNKEVKLRLYEAIKAKGDFTGQFSTDNGIMTFLSKIWPLRAMESEDSRFSNAYDDAFQHLINNNDWDTDATFLKRFRLIDGKDEDFQNFIEVVVHPETRGSKKEIQSYVETINEVLKKEKYILTVSDYYNELPIYRISEKSKIKEQSTDIVKNHVPFFVSKKISKYPCFTLKWIDWDDFGSKTTFDLVHHSNEEEYLYIGRVKVMEKGFTGEKTILPDEFYSLESEYCSMGQEGSYYKKLHRLYPDFYQSLLLALRDAALFPRIYERFENESVFKNSLIRENSVEKIRRTIRSELLGNPTSDFRFSFIYKPPYAGSDDGLINLYFNFETNYNFPERIVALIGKNGVGKTTLLNSLVENLRKQGSNNLVPNKLLFSKYFSVSYSAFDRFLPPQPHESFNYVYCGLKTGPTTLKTQEEQLKEFHDSAQEIIRRGLEYQWLQVLAAFLSEEHLNQLFPNYLELAEHGMASANLDNYRRIERQFSSGESILLHITTKIISEIRDDSLILYDEPETHLHPNAITDLINVLARLLDRFNSFCIMATHSPLVIRELKADRVLVLKRNGNTISAGPIAIDSFGQNLTVITEEIFGNREVSKLHSEKIRTLIQKREKF